MPEYLGKAPIKNLFDELPTDMIYYEIFPYLDYNSRVTANLLLPLKDRLRTPLMKDAILGFSIQLGTTKIIPLVRKQAKTANNIARNRLTLKIWRMLRMFPELYQYNSAFREVVTTKALEFSNTEELSNITRHTRNELKKLCGDFLLSLETCYPYVREVRDSSKIDDWSAVNMPQSLNKTLLFERIKKAMAAATFDNISILESLIQEALRKGIPATHELLVDAISRLEALLA